MILISHRGNLKGPNKEKENSPEYILKAAHCGYNVEIDVWHEKNNFFLGHDKPEYKISLEFLKNNLFWCHAKNISSLNLMIENGIHCFWHQGDDFTLTSNNFIWAYPSKHSQLPKKCINVMPEINSNFNIKKIVLEKEKYAGVCSDYIAYFKK